MVKIGTHDGTFHADEALGCWLLRRTQARGSGHARWAQRIVPRKPCSQPPCARRIVQAFRDADVVRTRDAALLSTLDVVIDVGAVYDPGERATLAFAADDTA